IVGDPLLAAAIEGLLADILNAIRDDLFVAVNIAIRIRSTERRAIGTRARISTSAQTAWAAWHTATDPTAPKSTPPCRSERGRWRRLSNWSVLQIELVRPLAESLNSLCLAQTFDGAAGALKM